MGETRRRGLDRGDQRVHHVVLDPVVEIARGDRPLEAAPFVLDRLVLGERVGDEREGAHILAEHGAERLRRLLARRRVLVRQQVERLGAGERLAPHREAERGHGLVEEAHPGGAACHLLLVQQPLDLVRKLEGAGRPRIPDPGCEAGERRVCELLPEHLLLDPVKLQREEEKAAPDRCGFFPDRLEEARRLGLVHRRAIDEIGVARQPLQDLPDHLVAGDEAAERRAVEGCDPAGEFLVQRIRLGGRPLEVGAKRVRIGAGVEVEEIPSRQGPVGGPPDCRALRPCRALRHRGPRPRPKAGLRRSRKAASPSRWSSERLVRLS